MTFKIIRIVFFGSYLFLTGAPFSSHANIFASNPPKLSNPNITLSTNHDVITCTLPKINGYPGITFDISRQKVSDTNGPTGGYAIKIRNSDSRDFRLFARIDDVNTAGKPQAWQATFELVPDSGFTEIRVPLPSSFHGMQLPPPEVFGPWQSRIKTYGPPPDEKKLVSLTLFAMNPTSPINFEISEISALPAPDLTGLVDRFGQSSRTNWPGKIQKVEDFQIQGEEEAKKLDQWEDENKESPLSLLIQPPTGESFRFTGFFRTALIQDGKEIDPRPLKVDGETARWWFVTPEGKLFFSLGMNCVNFGEDTMVKGREYLFQWLPPEAARSGKVNFFQLNLRRKYGLDWQDDFMEVTFRRLKMWGFNTLGNWCDPVFYQAGKMAYTKTLGYRKPPLIHSSCQFPDFFHRDFEENLKKGFAKGVEHSADDPLLIGYFVDNELQWDTWDNDGLADKATVARAALASPAGTPARDFFIEEVKSKYQTIEGFNKAWKMDWKGWDQTAELKDSQLTAVAKEDCRVFLGSMAEHYYSSVSKAVKEADPNHLYLGSRLAQRPPEVVAAAAKYCDVISFNCYDDTLEQKKWSFLNKINKPAMIGEFHFSAPDRGMFPGRNTRANQTEKFGSMMEYTKSVCSLPSFIGTHWFQYLDQPLTGRDFDSENYPIGFFPVNDNNLYIKTF